MKVKITVNYLGKSVNMVVDVDEENLVDESYKIGRELNMDRIVNDFYDNAQIDFEIQG